MSTNHKRNGQKITTQALGYNPKLARIFKENRQNRHIQLALQNKT